jgi:plastocyanin
MKKSFRSITVIAALVFGLLAVPLVVFADPPMSATVRFGLSNVGSPFPPTADHDKSTHAVDSVVPRTVVISQGGTVTFEIGSPVHQVAIYEPGTGPNDIDTGLVIGSLPGCPPVPLIADPDGLVAILDDQPCAGGSNAPSFTFTEPGRYLIVCTFLPHFVDNDMYSWVIVK